MKLFAPEVLAPVLGTLVDDTDWNQLVAFMESLSSIGLALQQGVTNALPPIQPVQALVASGTMSFAIGGPDTDHPQWALCQGLLCASVGSPAGTQVTFTVPNNSTGFGRVDAVICQPSPIQVGTVSREVQQPGGSKPVQDIPEVIQGLAFDYVTGPSGGANPTIPSGWELFAYVNVPNGATAIDDSNIDLQFPYMNPNSFTVTTDHVTVPDEGDSVILPVNDTSVWNELDIAYVVGPHSDNGFLAMIVSGGVDPTANTLTVQNINTAINGSGTMPVGALVVPAGIAPVVCSTTVTDVPSNIGGSFTVNCSSTGQFTQGTYGLLTGRVHGKGAYFIVTAQNSATQLQCTLIGLAQGGITLLGSTLLPGSTLNSCAPPGIIEEDQNNGGFLNPTMPSRIKIGSVVFSGAGSQTVSFATGTNFTDATTYQIFFGSNTTALDPTWGSKGAGGFDLTSAGAGTVAWIAIGY